MVEVGVDGKGEPSDIFRNEVQLLAEAALTAIFTRAS